MNKWLNNSEEFIWCPGCPLSWGLMTTIAAFEELKLKPENTWVVSGIGCTGRMANYFACLTAHTTHGRGVPVAEGIKLADPGKDVFLISGDGDLLSIGLSHLIHAARRNTPIKVICFNNSVYAMTGGQTSPTTPVGAPTETHPGGSPYLPIEPENLFQSFPKIFFRRTMVYHRDHFVETIKGAYAHPGFAFVEVISFCRINDPRFKQAKNPDQLIGQFLRRAFQDV